MSDKLLNIYMQIMYIAKAQQGIIFKMESARKPKAETSISITNMMDEKMFFQKRYDENRDKIEDSIKRARNHIKELHKRRGNVSRRKGDQLVEYINIYKKLVAFIRKTCPDLKITLCAIQYDSFQTSIVIESMTDNSVEPFMCNIDEDQAESYDELIKVCNAMTRTLNVATEEDDAMNVVVDNADNIDALFGKPKTGQETQ